MPVFQVYSDINTTSFEEVPKKSGIRRGGGVSREFSASVNEQLVLNKDYEVCLKFC